MRKSFNRGAARRETDPAGVPVKVLKRNPGKSYGRAHLCLVVGGPPRPFKDPRAQDIRPVTTQIGDEQEVTVWALMLVLGLSILMAGYILCAKTSGFACRTSPSNATTVMVADLIGAIPRVSATRFGALGELGCERELKANYADLRFPAGRLSRRL